jgi:CDGSH-type Zn-finger protein
MGNTADPADEVPGPYRIRLKGSREYLWCSCGRSRKQPLCDASHEGTGSEPVSYRAAEDITVAFCGCKLTKKPPFCDGSHVHGVRTADGRVVRKDAER